MLPLCYFCHRVNSVFRKQCFHLVYCAEDSVKAGPVDFDRCRDHNVLLKWRAGEDKVYFTKHAALLVFLHSFSCSLALLLCILFLYFLCMYSVGQKFEKTSDAYRTERVSLTNIYLFPTIWH